MSTFLCKSIAFGRYRVTTLAQTTTVCSPRWFSITTTSERKRSFVVSYLIDSLGFSPKAALSASRHIKFDSPEKPDKVVEFFKGYGFTHSQISRLVRGYPKTLVCDAEKIILPKLEFFMSKGISGPELAKGLSVYPGVLRCSLDNHIVRNYEFLRKLFGSDERTIRAAMRFPDILQQDVEKHMRPNVAVLREHGVPRSNIARFLGRNPRDILVDSESFRGIVEEVVAMGFDPATVRFVLAVSVTRGLSKTKWESKVSVYKKWGWSEEEVFQAFRNEPHCRKVSEDKISACMDFFINKIGWAPSVIAKNPDILSMSLEKRIIPRCVVYQHLLSKGLIKKEIYMRVFKSSNQKFLQKFVHCYEKEAPELLKLFNREVSSFE